MSHRNAPLSETGRLRLARCVVEDEWPLRQAAQRFQVSVSTAQRWAGRYRNEGEPGMADRSSRPRTSPRRTPSRTERRIVKVRLARRWGPARIAYHLRLNPSTVHRVLTRFGMARLAHLDRARGVPVRRYERDEPGELVHVDIKKLGNIPDGGGHRVMDRSTGNQHKKVTTTARYPHGKPKIGYSYLHNAVDDHSRLAYTEILSDESKHAAVAFWARAQAFFATHGITVQRVLTDNGSCYRSRDWRQALTAAGITHTRTRPYRPQTNGKVERFNRTLLDEWAYARPYRSETERRASLPQWLHTYNHHRGHTALAGHPPASRVPNLSGQNT
ncbi:IS481 family transposase [Allokutzneria albata]|uniref:Transposase n=1 Tax=Allokutzneria albata TaxID=211114 RepID=A0A1H0DPB4_ALLAB|nr:IS481 family transposase [Allokutzneria albata]SDM96065.1 Transposase [Allokutzneria albata]SDN71831.1 Transposase [Allokutzneria albata]